MQGPITLLGGEQQLIDKLDAMLVGNDDPEQMSAWLIFTSLGFYPVALGSNEYVIGRPFVDKATLHLSNGSSFRIVAENLSPSNAFISRRSH